MTRRRSALLLTVVTSAGLGLGVARALSRGGDEVPTFTVARRPFSVTVHASGELKPQRAITVSAGRSGQPLTIAWLAPEGSQVSEGDLVVEFDASRVREAYDTADAEVRKIEQELAKHEVQAEGRRSDLVAEETRARISHEKSSFKASLDEAVVPRIEIDQARMDLRLAEVDMDRVDRKKVSQGPKDEASRALLEIRLEKATNQLQMARTNLEATRARAPAKGVVAYKQTWKGSGMAKVAPGDTIWPGRPVLELPDLSSMEFLAQVRQEDAVLVAEDLEAEVRLHALPNRPLKARVKKVAAVAQQHDPRDPVKWVEVRLGLESPPGDLLRSGLTGEATIRVRSEPAALVVPRDAVVSENGARYVYLEEDGRPVRRPVTPGAESESEIQIAQGLSEGERVFLRDPTRTPEEIEALRRARQEEARAKRKQTTGGGGEFFVIMN